MGVETRESLEVHGPASLAYRAETFLKQGDGDDASSGFLDPYMSAVECIHLPHPHTHAHHIDIQKKHLHWSWNCSTISAGHDEGKPAGGQKELNEGPEAQSALGSCKQIFEALPVTRLTDVEGCGIVRARIHSLLT